MNSPRPRLRVVLVGWGAISRTVAELLVDHPIDIVAVAKRDWSKADPERPSGATALVDPSELAATSPDLVVEAAGRDAVGSWSRAALHAGADVIVSSVSALADPSLLAELRDTAVRNGAQIHIQPGALGGVDALAAARPLGIESVEHRIIKPPGAWIGTPAETLCDLATLTAPTTFFVASAGETADAFPKNANVAMTTALAGIGPDATRVSLVADPSATTNRHEISARGVFGDLQVAISNKPLPDNPKTSGMAAFNLARVVTNRVSAIVI